ncbi:DNA-binding LytR/AlgR family response regulator [Clostridium acetobutylicum]|uniref:Stage 0 sporulation protein A homolog n=1 Tax=Clostridium acetobutylicum (strain ATCC 824 / DSM 792 / JCM 1419 / IAM 19013 / LMG 5710 / NBRC 13948 / NRRL B-527 / VKM B-1787 / 2291 / W) TaxID=272562 RepID=Q97IQ9_CLOAB|nr:MULTISPECIES: LytTR family DNA-binding domain-containing protein [Clostridium]AAK79548.1 Response regulator (CheY-like receiver domain and HTH DNA-binding domain) [Clostridium acetobutylicum ATCC 824]ADZ20633.1 Response regulator (CheY-like receiver domain and HTH DNA-binding domain) [Clostridium acetobutylicum EA 2018]AEI34674.1 response regulator [Clostridium acetobutylicum DSM 1731]AWV81209.1 DNA-binding response regulator [Clostridium acetobutylicum]MBC2392840.1 response regulator trans
MLKIAVCDDNDIEREEIVHIINKHLKYNQKDFTILKFEQAEQVLKSIIKFDLYFLDIKMEKMNGIELAKNIRNISKDAVIIFVTSYRDYVFDAFDVRAFNYIIKPIDQERIKKILNEALAEFEKQDRFIITKTISKSTKVFLRDITYIEAEKRKIKIHTTYDVIEYYNKISQLEEELREYNFFRCHKSYIVNLGYVKSYDNTSITLENNDKIYISKYRLNDFLKTFMYYLKGEA